MKKSLFAFLILLPALVTAQFPAPDSLQIVVHYITIDQTDWCGDQYVYGPNYCNLFIWQTPDTAGTPATLTGYRLYKDDEFFKSSADNFSDTVGGFLGSSFFVTAMYENPAGESAPSNVEVINDLPFAAKEVTAEEEIRIGFDGSQRLLMVEGAENARVLKVFNVNGRQVLYTNRVSRYHYLYQSTAGVYEVLVQDRQGRIWVHKIVIF